MILLVSPVFSSKLIQSPSNLATIIYSQGDVFKINNNVSLLFHFFNSSNYVLNNSLYNCIIDVYNPFNNQIISNNSLLNIGNFDVFLNINKSFINITGYYSYIIWCNSSSQSAFISNSFLINNSGSIEDNNDWLAIALIFLFISIIFFYASFIIKNENLQMIKILFFVYGGFTLFFSGFIPYIISLNPSDIYTFNNLGESLVYVYGLGFLAFVFMYGYHLIINIGTNKRDKYE